MRPFAPHRASVGIVTAFRLMLDYLWGKILLGTVRSLKQQGSSDPLCARTCSGRWWVGKGDTRVGGSYPTRRLMAHTQEGFQVLSDGPPVGELF